jgi:hypothetical protein
MTIETTEKKSKKSGTNGAQPEATAGAQGDMPPPIDTSAKPKRVVKRKPLWLALPKEYADIVTDDGEIQRSPTLYELYECANKAEVGKVLSKLGLDATNLNPEHVKIFRADPLPLRLNTQVTLKF